MALKLGVSAVLLFLSGLCIAVDLDINVVDTGSGSHSHHEGTTPRSTETATIQDRGRLLKILFNSYDTNNYPSNIVLKHGLSLFNVQPLPEEDYALQLDLFQRMSWNDSRLSWNPKAYGGIEYLRVNADRVWLPDIHAYNSVANPAHAVCSSPRVIISHEGKVDWIPSCKEKVSCKNLTLPWQPFAKQSCVLKYGSWTMDGHSLDLEAWDAKKPDPEIHNEWSGTSSKWTITGGLMSKRVMYYDGAPEPYVTLEYLVEFQQRQPSPTCTI